MQHVKKKNFKQNKRMVIHWEGYVPSKVEFVLDLKKKLGPEL